MSETTLNPVDAGQAAVVEQPNGVSATADTTPDAGNGTASGVANQGQSAEANARFAEMRRKMERSAREAEAARAELAKAKADAEKFTQLVGKQYGYEGDAQAIADQLEAAATGKTVEDIRAARTAAEQQADQVRKLQEELELYKPLATQQFKSKLLADVKAVYPDVAAESVDDFGDEFTKLIGAGVDPAVAYAATQNVAKAQEKPVPPQIGAVNSKAASESEYFTKDEVAKMSKAEVKKHYEKIRKSMPTWG